MIRSLKWQVALGALVILATSIAGVGGAIYWWVEQELRHRLGDSLRLTASSAASHVSLEGVFLELYHDKLGQIETGREVSSAPSFESPRRRDLRSKSRVSPYQLRRNSRTGRGSI
jgi:hypothetical protein